MQARQARLKWLSLRSFRSFVERTVIPFPESGVVPIRGFNLETGGSSGSGKSSVNLGITYALGICPFPATTLQSWLTSVPLQVELCLAIDEGEMIISRGETFSLSINGEITKGSAKAIEAKITQTLGLSPDILEALTYRKQQSRGQFLSKTNLQKQEFLTALLGLEKFELAVEKTQACIRELEPSVILAQEEVKRCEGEVAQKQQNIKKVELLDEGGISKTVEETKMEIQNIEDRTDIIKAFLSVKERAFQETINSIALEHVPYAQKFDSNLQTLMSTAIPQTDRSKEINLNDLLKQAESHLTKVIAEDKEGLAAEQCNARFLQATLDGHKQNLIERDQIKVQGLVKLTEIESLEKNICPTCQQQWAQAQERKKKLEFEIEQLALELQEQEYQDVEKSIEFFSQAVTVAWKHIPHPDIERLRKIQSNIMQELSEEKAHNANLQSLYVVERKQKITEIEANRARAKTVSLEKIEKAKVDAQKELQSSYQELENLQRSLKEAHLHLQGHQQEAYRIQAQNRTGIQQAETEARVLDQAQCLLVASQGRAKVATGRLGAERDFLALIGKEGYLGSIFDEVLWEISDATNQILAGIPNTACVTVHFSSEATTQKGKIVKEIAPIVKISGHEAPIKAGCSGGMFAAVELAIDLAVASVVSRRTGVVPAWTILDESFEGLGPVEKEGCLEVLQSCAFDKLVLLVDHASEMKGISNMPIDVEFKDGISKIRGKS